MINISSMNGQTGSFGQANYSHPYLRESETIEEARASRMKYNPTDWELEAWVSTYVAIATGEMSVVSHTIQRLPVMRLNCLLTISASIQKAISTLLRPGTKRVQNEIDECPDLFLAAFCLPCSEEV